MQLEITLINRLTSQAICTVVEADKAQHIAMLCGTTTAS
jgi:hypothetical protein